MSAARRRRRCSGARLGDLFSAERGVAGPWLAFEYPLWGPGRQARRNARVRARGGPSPGPGWTSPTAPCATTRRSTSTTCTSLQARRGPAIAAEARGVRTRPPGVQDQGGARRTPSPSGEGNAARHRDRPRRAGRRRPRAALLLDANNGYNLNLAKRVLDETADCGVFWLEEAFHEDPVLYRDLRVWLQGRDLPVLIADGEGVARPARLGARRDRGRDPVRHLRPRVHALAGNRGARRLGRPLGAAPLRGTLRQLYACHLAGALRGFTYVEWDEATTPGLTLPATGSTKAMCPYRTRPASVWRWTSIAFRRAGVRPKVHPFLVVTLRAATPARGEAHGNVLTTLSPAGIVTPLQRSGRSSLAGEHAGAAFRCPR